jgi:hypothetical protein
MRALEFPQPSALQSRIAPDEVCCLVHCPIAEGFVFMHVVPLFVFIRLEQQIEELGSKEVISFTLYVTKLIASTTLHPNLRGISVACDQQTKGLPRAPNRIDDLLLAGSFITLQCHTGEPYLQGQIDQRREHRDRAKHLTYSSNRFP